MCTTHYIINTVSLLPANDAVLAPSNLAVPLFTLGVLRGCKMSSFHADRLVESWMLLLLSRRKTNLRDIAFPPLNIPNDVGPAVVPQVP